LLATKIERAQREDTMRPTIILCCAVALVACAKSDKSTADSAAAATAAPPPAPPPPPPIKLSDVAGKWNMTGKNEAGDSTLVTYVFTATADTTGWSIKFKDRAKPVPVHVVAVEGDSIVIDAGPYPSVLRKGVNVRTHGPMRLQNGKLVGTVTAHYSVKTADSVRRVLTEGTRAP
jgi:hypothetical protein